MYVCMNDDRCIYVCMYTMCVSVYVCMYVYMIDSMQLCVCMCYDTEKQSI